MNINVRHTKAAISAGVVLVLLAVSWLFIDSRAAIIPECGSTITEDLTLGGDLTCPEGFGLTIDGEGITIDLNGHTITGTGPGRRSWPVPTFEHVGLRITADNVHVLNGQISRFGTSILIEEAQNAEITGVRTTGSYYGLYLIGGGQHEINLTTVARNVYGLTLYESNGNTITNSQMSQQTHHSPGGYGVYLSGSSGNRLENNTIEENLNWGLWFSGSSDNTIVRNNVIGNDPQVSDDSGGNRWYDPQQREGNYWSDYGGPDENNDGVGDVPYHVGGPGRSVDLFPIIQPDGWTQPNRATLSVPSPTPQPPAPPLAYVALDNGQIAVIDLAQQSQTALMTTDVSDGDMSLGPDGSTIYVIAGDEVRVIETDSGKVVDSYPIDGALTLAATYDGKRLIISTDQRGVAIDLERDEIDNQPKLDDAVAILPSWKHNLALIARRRGTLNVLYLAGHHVPYEHPLGGTPSEIIDNRSGTAVYVVLDRNKDLDVYETEFFQHTDSIPLHGIPAKQAELAIAPDGSTIYILNKGTGRLLAVDLATHEITAEYTPDQASVGLVASSNGEWLAVAQKSGALMILDSQLNVLAEIELPSTPIGITALR